MYALVDCNNFFVSCERVFRPELNNRPVIVLSSNDGCAVARSNEAKALDIGMGAPLFKIKDIVEKHNVECISGNLAFYGDMSRRVMSVLRDIVPALDVYSIDEAFLDLSGIPHDELKPLCQRIRKTVQQYTGIPVSIGIAPTKTLAKAASNVAKKYPEANGVYDISTLKAQRAILQRMDVGDIWGIGRKLREKFHNIDMPTAWHLRECDPSYVRQLTSVIVQKTVLELRGTPCYEMGEAPHYRKQVISSRSFGKPVTELKDLKQAIASFVATASKKLRDEKTLAKHITVYGGSSPFKKDQYSNSTIITLDSPTSNARLLTKAAMEGTIEIYRKGVDFKKAGICFSGIIQASEYQPSLFEPVGSAESDKLMSVMDDLNKSMGDNTLGYAIAKPTGKAKTLSEKRSPAYTSKWDELLIVE